MENFYLKQKNILSDDVIDFLIEESKEMKFSRSKVVGYGNKRIDDDIRTSTEVMFDKKELPDVATSIINLSFKLEMCSGWEDVACREQMSLLKYEVGGKFIKHHDVLQPTDNRSRYFSSSILIDKSPDLIGGDLILYEDDVPYIIDLEVGEAVVFHSRTWHEVTEIKQGWRLALIAWLSK